MIWGAWPRFSRDTAEGDAFSASVLNITMLVLSLVVIFAVVTQLLTAIGAISLSATLQLTMWLVALGLITLLWIAYMACLAYVTANTTPPDAVKHLVPAGVQTNRDGHGNLGTADRRIAGVYTDGDGHGSLGTADRRIARVHTDGDGRAEHADQAEQARTALAAAEEQLDLARAQAAKAEHEAKSAQEWAVKVEQEAKAARTRAAKAEQEAKARLVDDVTSRVADWQKDKPRDSRNL
jgi:hypothetical protein